MGKPTGFMELGRKTPQKRPARERVGDYLEIYSEPSDEAIRAQASRCMDCGVPFCNSGCPLGNIIPDWNDLVYRGKWRDALERLHRTNNFPEFTGRICPAPCESACVLGINDDPVTIEFIEKTIAEHGFAEGWVTPEPPATRSGRKVAVIGSGPAGLAAAAQLNRAGHSVTLFEKKDRVGGLLRYGIPDFKLEKWTIDRRVELMIAEGVEIRTGVHVGRDVSGPELLREFDAVLLAGGAESPRDLKVSGRELDGVHFAMDFLEQQNRRIAGDDVPEQGAILATGKNVLVLGGGDTGSDCIGTSHRQGAKHVYNFELLERPPESRPHDAPWPVHPGPSQILRTSTSHEEGGSRDWGVSSVGFIGDGRVQKLHAVRVRFGAPDANGRREMETIAGSEFTLDVDLVLLAMGFLGPVRDDMLKQFGVSLSERGNVATQGYATSVPRVYAAGDMRRGQSLVVWAIAEGREAAAQIDRDLSVKSR
ncbi:MAG TPA: glutamate synthase subunit beta [Myxococcota bacterium]|nr:glutamate synthase subunit beta [Myxococcota bacterium]